MSDLEKLTRTGERIVSHLCLELKMLHSSWAHWEALNGHDAKSREGFRLGVMRLAHINTVENLRCAILRDTIMTLFRMSDAVGKKHDRNTLCQIASLLEDIMVKERLLDLARDWNPSEFGLSNYNAALCKTKIDYVASHVSPRWEMPPSSRELYDLRDKLRPVRDGVLAHALDSSSLKGPTCNQIRHMISLTTELVHASQLVFKGSAPCESALPHRVKEANDFWDYAETGFRSQA